MGITITVSGKGGVGKTNLSALLVRTLSDNGSVLAIDADPDSNLPQALGVNVENTVGSTREAILNAPARSKMASAKREALEVALHESIAEFPQFDIIAMGRPEGSGCYCGVNSIISQVIDYKAMSYDFTIIDCHAGLEHLSRRTVRDVDVMVVVVEPAMNSLLTAERIIKLSQEIHIDFGGIMVVANKVTPETKPLLDKMAQEKALEIADYISYEPEIAYLNAMGKPVTELHLNSPVSLEVNRICAKIVDVTCTV